MTQPYVIADVAQALKLGKVIIPLRMDVNTPWPPVDPTLKAAFGELIYVSFKNAADYFPSLQLLKKVLAPGLE